MDNFKKDFSEKLFDLRKKRGLTQTQLANEIGYSEKAISKWESGTCMPPIETLIVLAEFFHVGVEDMLYRVHTAKYFLGIDGGGTKTLFALADDKGQIIRTICLGASNPVDIGLEKSQEILAEGIEACVHGIVCSEVSLYAGIAGGTDGMALPVLMSFLRRYHFANVQIGNDAENIVSAGLAGENGIAVIMGTGMNVFTQNGDNINNFGGFGYLFEDGLCGYNLGRDAVNASLRELGGFGKKTLITKLLREKCGIDPMANITEFYSKGKRFIASWAPEVCEAYRKGDEAAIDIITARAKESAQILRRAREEFAAKSTVKTVFVGGLLKNEDVMIPVLKKVLGADAKKFAFEVYPYEPVLGALRLAGAPIDTHKEFSISRGTIR